MLPHFLIFLLLLISCGGAHFPSPEHLDHFDDDIPLPSSNDHWVSEEKATNPSEHREISKSPWQIPSSVSNSKTESQPVSDGTDNLGVSAVTGHHATTIYLVHPRPGQARGRYAKVTQYNNTSFPFSKAKANHDSVLIRSTSLSERNGKDTLKKVEYDIGYHSSVKSQTTLTSSESQSFGNIPTDALYFNKANFAREADSKRKNICIKNIKTGIPNPDHDNNSTKGTINSDQLLQSEGKVLKHRRKYSLNNTASQYSSFLSYKSSNIGWKNATKEVLNTKLTASIYRKSLREISDPISNGSLNIPITNVTGTLGNSTIVPTQFYKLKGPGMHSVKNKINAKSGVNISDFNVSSRNNGTITRTGPQHQIDHKTFESATQKRHHILTKNTLLLHEKINKKIGEDENVGETYRRSKRESQGHGREITPHQEKRVHTDDKQEQAQIPKTIIQIEQHRKSSRNNEETKLLSIISNHDRLTVPVTTLKKLDHSAGSPKRDISCPETDLNFLQTPAEEEEERNRNSKSFWGESKSSAGEKEEKKKKMVEEEIEEERKSGDRLGIETYNEGKKEREEREERKRWNRLGVEKYDDKSGNNMYSDMKTETDKESEGRTNESWLRQIPLVRKKRKMWSFVIEDNTTSNDRVRDIATTPNKQSYPSTHNSQNPPMIKKHMSHQLKSNDTHFVRAPPNASPAERRASRSLTSYGNKPWVRSLGMTTKLTKGERSFTKTPQQRHSRSRSRTKRKASSRQVWALAGDTTLLPCDLTAAVPKDSVQMVMWLKEGTHTPLFSVDYREPAGGGPQVWRDNTASTALRAHLRIAGSDVGKLDLSTYGTNQRQHNYEGLRAGYHDDRGEEDDEDQPGLIVRNVEGTDSAIYRCRVDFLLTPTRNTRVNLTAVVPPVSVTVSWWMDENGNMEENGEVGPFRVGDVPTLVCLTRNAWPAPRLVWFEEDSMVDDTYASDPGKDKGVENTLVLNPLTRDHHHRRFTCIATNSNLTRPVASTVHINMALDVLMVGMEEVEVMSAGAEVEVKCTVWGSNPPPIVTWSLANTILPSAKPWVSNDGNRSVSVVHFTPQPTHDGSQLQCSAHNPALTSDGPQHNPSLTHRHSTVISVNYAPQVSVSLGRSLDATNIKEGDDLYFECSAVAKPPPHKVTWQHNGQELLSSPGVLVSNMTLVLQEVDRSNAGAYTCLATNMEGSATSQPLKLDIKYAPVCASDHPSQHSVAKHENARISCNVLANPPVVEFSWSFNNTAEAVKVPEDRYVMKGTESVVNYTPVTELDYGTLLCWANNDIGRQIQPCVFQIVAAGKPDPPHNCRAYDVTISSLQVSCLPGDDGGLGQTFLLEVLETNGDYKPAVIVSREQPSFFVSNLLPATAYRLLVKARNIKGESRPAELSAYTVALDHPQHETRAEPTRGRENSSVVTIGVLVGAVLACLPVVIAVTVMTCRRARAVRRAREEEMEKEVAEIETIGKDRQGPAGPGGGGLSEGGTDITTITGGVGMTSTTPTTTPGQGNTKVVARDPHLLYSGARTYSPNRCQNVGVGPQVLATGAAPLRQGPYPSEEKGKGEGELLVVTVPPPAGYNQGYQAAYPAGQTLSQCYERMKPGYPVLQHVLPGSQMPISGYPASNGSQTNLQYISSVPLSQGYSPQLGAANKASKLSSSYITLPDTDASRLSSGSTMSLDKEGSKMSMVYNPMTLMHGSQIIRPDADQVFNTGSLKRGIKPNHGQDLLRLRDTTRSRSASLTSVTSKKESSV